jgi:hypothetical protein
MSNLEPGPSPEFLSWLVPARSQIQASLLRLFEVTRRKRNELSKPELLNESHIYRLLIGVGFSLWRAVFQAHKDLSISNNLEDAENFLQALVHDNAVVYSTEKNSWSFGYYLNNAKYRILDVLQRLPEPSKTENTPSAATIDRDSPPFPSSSYSQDTWNELHNVFDRLVKDLRRRLQIEQ